MSCAFGVQFPFSDEGFAAIERIIRKTDPDTGKVSEMDPSSLSDQYLLLVGNFQVSPFHVSDPKDIVFGRQVTPNTPILSIITRSKNDKNETSTIINFRDRLLVNDTVLRDATQNVSTSTPSQRRVPTAAGEPKKPMLSGCLPIIRGPQVVTRESDDMISGLVGDWYISLGVYYAMGSSAAAIAAGHQRALASAESINSPMMKKFSKKGGKYTEEEKRIKKAMRRNADRSARILALLGQTDAQYGYVEHNSTLDSFWSSNAAIRAKAKEDALSRAEILAVRKQLDGKCSSSRDEYSMVERYLRDSFFRSVNRSGGGYEMFDQGFDMGRFADFLSDNSAARNAWQQYAEVMRGLSKHEKRVFNIEGLFSALNSFKFPLVPEQGRKKTVGGRHRLNNLKAANKIINGIAEMTLQSAIDGTGISDIIGSVSDGWGNTTAQPSRVKALKTLSNFSGNGNVVSIPVSRAVKCAAGSRGGETLKCVDIPSVIIANLISDKRILDQLCGGGMNLAHEITNFIETIAGKEHTGKESVFLSPRLSVILLRYIWFNAAVVSLTDSNIKMPLNTMSEGTGDDIYRDYLAIRGMVNNYNSSLSSISVKAISDRYNCGSGNTSTSNKNVTIKTQGELLTVLQQTANALSAFTNKGGVGATPDAANMANVISPIANADVVKNTNVVVSGLDRITETINFFSFLSQIKTMNENIEEYLRRYRLGEGLDKKELDNFVYPNIAAIVKRELGVSGSALSSNLDTDRPITIDLNTEQPLIVKASKGYASNRYAKLFNKTTRTAAEQAQMEQYNAQMAANTIPQLVNRLTIPGSITADTAINVVKAFTENGEFSNAETHLGVMGNAINEMQPLFTDGFNVANKRLTVNVGSVSKLIQNGLTVSLILAHSKASPYVFKPLVQDFAKLLLAVTAETSLVVSRSQKSFFPIPPSVFSSGGLFKIDREMFDNMKTDYVVEVIRQLSKNATAAIERCNDSDSAARIAKSGEIYNKDVASTTAAPGTSSSALTLFANNLQNPAKVWSMGALPHFDMAVVPKLHGISHDQMFRLSTYYQGIHKMELNSDCKPEEWDNSLPGNRASKFFGLSSVSDNNRSFNLALDTLLASPAEICDLVTREMVKTSNDIVHNIGSNSNTDALQKSLQVGASAVEKYDESTLSTKETDVYSLVSALAKSKSPLSSSSSLSSEGHLTSKEIDRTWNTPALLGTAKTTSYSVSEDALNAPLSAVLDFRRNVVDATKSLYEVAAVCSVMSKEEDVRSSSRKIMGMVEQESPVMQDIGIDRIASLVSTVATPKQHRRFLQTVNDYKNYLIRKVASNPLLSSRLGGISPTSGNTDYNLKAVYDGVVSSSSSMTPSSMSVSDRFWSGVFSQCLETGPSMFADAGHGGSNMFQITAPKLYGSRVNTYAALSSGVERLRDSISSATQERKNRIAKSIEALETFVTDVVGGDTLDQLRKAQNMYNKLSDITSNSIYSDFGNIDCAKIMKNVTSKKMTARQQSDTILSSLLHELAGLVHKQQPQLATQFALASHVIKAKYVTNDLNNIHEKETFSQLMAVAGVADYYNVSAAAMCQRLVASDVTMFLGGTMLQQGLFVSFLLNNVLFSQVSDNIKMNELNDETKSLLVKLVGFCGTVSDALGSRHVSSIRRVQNEEDKKLDRSFVTSLYSAYRDLRKKTELYRETDTINKLFGHQNFMSYESSMLKRTSLVHDAVSGPRPRRYSTLEDVLEAPSTVHKSFMVSYPERAAASRRVKRAGLQLWLITGWNLFTGKKS
uniref:Wssv142 n=1 Tax=White spot syndrome virus TaxID=342409 RepID=A0A3G5BHJ7_9VIRU|nr:wssv142 [White spot syndrome virus]